MLYSSRNRNAVMALTLLLFVIAGCSDDSSSNVDDLKGDLSFEIKGQTSVNFDISKVSATGAGIPNQGLVEESVQPPEQGDLEDGDYNAYVLEAQPEAGKQAEAEQADVTLILRSDGDVVKETSSFDNQFNEYRIEVGNVPDFDDL